MSDSERKLLERLAVPYAHGEQPADWWRGFPDVAPARGSTLEERLDDGEVWP